MNDAITEHGTRRAGERSAVVSFCRLWLVAIVSLWGGWCTGLVSAAPSFEDQIWEINDAARSAREKNDLPTVEQKRRERWLLIAEFAGKKDPPDSPWIRGYQALQVVDGSETTVEENVGLLNTLKYKEACEVLKKAFDDMAADGNGPLLGEVATRLFEVAQQAKGVFREALVRGSPDYVVDIDDIVQVLEVASKRDPCCISAVPMIMYVQRPDPKEAFLRAEVRDSFKKRQKQLVEVSHPLILPKRGGSPPGGNAPGPSGGGPASGPKPPTLEHEDAPVMPWHAAAELDKAMSLQYILADLEYTKNLTPDHYLVRNGVPVYAIPGRIFSGTDAELSPCQLIYGQILLARSSDEGGRRRSVAFFLATVNKEKKKEFAWDHRYIDLLWRVPAPDELAKDESLRRKQELLGSHAPQKKWKLGDQEFWLYDFPIRDTEKCLQQKLRVLCVKSTEAVVKMKFRPTQNSPDAVSNLQTPEERLARTPFTTSWPVQASIDAFKTSNNPTKHGLIDLMQAAQNNPLVVVSEQKPGSKLGDKSPNLYPGESREEFPYIMLDEGRKLHIAVTGRPESPCSWVEYDGATAYLPLTPKAIPRALLLGSEIGSAFVKVLKAAGYTEDEAVSEIMKAMNEGGEYVPDRFKRLLNARYDAKRKELLRDNVEKMRWEKAFDPWLKRYYGITLKSASPNVIKAAVAAEMLEEEGWYGRPQLKPALDEMFERFGFRYLRDRRGNWIMARALIDEDGSVADDTNGGSPSMNDSADGAPAGRAKKSRSAASGNGPPSFGPMASPTTSGPPSLDDYPFAYLAQDGKRAVEKSQIYAWSDYLQLKESILLEHLNKMLCFHPCLPAIEVIQFAHDTPLQHPDFNEPAYMKGFVEGPQEGAVNGPVLTTAAIPTLTAPFPAWVVEGDETQAKALASLYAAYMKKLVVANSDSAEVSYVVERLRSVKNLQEFYDENDAEMQAKLAKMSLFWTQRLAAVSRHKVEAMLSTWQVQLESARDYARRKYFHKSIVWYNDLLSQLSPDNEYQSDLLIFTNVPTTETAGLFVDNIQKLIEDQRILVNVQVELGGVLNASGLKPSAYFVWQRTIDDYEFFLKPALTIAEDLMQSYGLSMTRRAEEAAKSLEETVEICRTAMENYGLKEDWHNLEADASADIADAPEPPRSVVEIRADLELDNAGKLSDAERERLESECEALGGDRRITFVDWLRLKKALVEFRPTLAFRTRQFSPPWLACPAPYDAETGFADSADAARVLVTNADVDAILGWCKKSGKDANVDPVAVQASALLGWYWLDVGRESLARAAFVNLARIKQATAVKRRRSVEGLIDEMHSYMAITAAGASMGSMPGLSAYRANFSSLLKGQLLDWEKRWFAQGAYGPHASQQRSELLTLAAQAKSQMSRASRDWRSNRYFFPDYAFEYGAVPDYLVEKLLNTPDLFRTLSEEEVKRQGADAVEGSSWVPISEADATAFLDKNKLDAAIDEDIVFMGK